MLYRFMQKAQKIGLIAMSLKRERIAQGQTALLLSSPAQGHELAGWASRQDQHQLKRETVEQREAKKKTYTVKKSTS
jgi:hypothetical protein